MRFPCKGLKREKNALAVGVGFLPAQKPAGQRGVDVLDPGMGSGHQGDRAVNGIDTHHRNITNDARVANLESRISGRGPDRWRTADL
jgi:hypothetical protein